MGGVEMERHLGVGLTPPTLNHQEKPPDTQSTSGGVGGGRGQPRPLSRLVNRLPTEGKLRRSDLFEKSKQSLRLDFVHLAKTRTFKRCA